MKKVVYLFIFVCTFFICSGNIKAAPVIEDGVYEIKSALNDNMAVDLYQGLTKNLTNIELFSYNGGNNQRWEIKSLGDGYYSITTVLNNTMALDVSGAKEIVPGTNVQLYESTGRDNQKWMIKDAGDGYYYIVSKCDNLYLDVYMGLTNNGTNIQVFSYNGGNNQKFKLNKTNKLKTKTVSDGTYEIQSAMKEDMVLDASGAVVDNGSNVQLFPSQNKDSQKWNVQYLGNGYYSMTAALNNNVSLDVYGGRPITPGTNVQLFSYSGGKNQKWIIEDAGDGYYYIISDYNNLYLDVYMGLTNNGTNIQVFSYNGGKNQKFKFVEKGLEEPSQTISDGTYVIQSALKDKMSIDLYQGLTNNETNIELFSYNGGNNQKWNVKHLGDGYYSITTSLSDSMSLDIYGGRPITAGSNVQLYQSSGSENQKWVIKDAGDGYYYIVSKYYNLYLDVYAGLAQNGTNMQAFSYNGGNNQKFKFIPTETNVDYQAYPNGVYSIETVLTANSNTKQVFDVVRGLKTDGTNITLFQNGFRNNQLWYLNYVKDGYYILKSAMNIELVLTAKNNNVALYKYDGSNSQLWRLKDLGNGDVALISKDSELYVTLDSSGATDGTNISVASGNGSDLQKFKLNKYNGTKTYRGIDISRVQGDIDWEKLVNSGLVDFVIIKGGSETTSGRKIDSKFEEYVQKCEDYNIPYAIYIYSYADYITGSKKSAESEAQMALDLIEQIKSKNNSSPTLGTKVFIDMEEEENTAFGKPTLTAMAKTFCTKIENNNYPCGIYANSKWLTNWLDTSALAKNFDIWLARWPEGDRYVTHAEAMTWNKPVYSNWTYKYWQFTSHGTIPGINDRVDLDLGYDIFG